MWRLALIIILTFSFCTRIWQLDMPSERYFDEVYHTVTASLMAQNDPRAFEWSATSPIPDTAIDWLHPPLAKYTQAISITLFGDQAFGWRLSSALFGTGVIYLTYRLGLVLFSRKIGVMAAGIASLDGLLLVQSRITMNDVHVTFFILLTLVWYLEYRRSPELKMAMKTAIALGLAASSKWSGVFVGGLIGLSEGLVFGLRVVGSEWVKSKKLIGASLRKKVAALQKYKMVEGGHLNFGLMVVGLVVIPIIIYFVSYGLMFSQGKDLAHFRELHQQIWWYQTKLEATHNYQSVPWQWFLNLRPVWYYVRYEAELPPANIYALGNPTLHWFGVFTVVYSLMWLAGRLALGAKKSLLDPSWLKLAWLMMAYAIVWLPWIISPRIMFYYHYLPAVPLLSLLIAYWLKTAVNQKISALLFLIMGVSFVLFFPHWTGLTPHPELVRLYELIPSWK